MKKLIIELLAGAWIAGIPALLMGVAIFVSIGDMSRGTAIVLGAVYLAIGLALAAVYKRGDKK
jgi:hypothetical protein